MNKLGGIDNVIHICLFLQPYSLLQTMLHIQNAFERYLRETTSLDAIGIRVLICSRSQHLISAGSSFPFQSFT